MIRPLARTLSAVLLLALCGAAPSSITPTARILVLNEGEEPIYTVSRSLDGGAWSADLLGMTQVIGIGEGRWMRLPLRESSCAAVLQAAYPDGHTAVAGVDLCAAGHVIFRH